MADSFLDSVYALPINSHEATQRGDTSLTAGRDGIQDDLV